MLSAELRYTEQVSLNTVIDPLGLRVLKVMEDKFLRGITTQTERLRYFTFLTWLYQKKEKKNLNYRQMLTAEKIFTLIAKHHHLNDKNPPRGIRNSMSSGKFLEKKQSFKIESYKEFGVGGRNKMGYGNYYYSNPLRDLGIFHLDSENNLSISIAGKKIADIFGSIRKNDPFEMTETTMKHLSRLMPYCLCRENISEKEKESWRLIFFGHTQVRVNGDLDFSKNSFNEFWKRGIIDSRKYRNWNRIYAPPDSFEEILNTTQDEEIIKRQYSLLLAMNIVAEAKPQTDSLNQSFRDAIYFKQIHTKSGWLPTNFGKLEHLRSLWEVYVHNLYYISVMEGIFFFFLKLLETKPFGARINEIINEIDEKRIRKTFENMGFSTNWKRIEELPVYIQKTISHKSTLEKKLNEREVFLRAIESSEEEILGYLIILLLLLRHRYSSFDVQQKEMLNLIASRIGDLSPSSLYQNYLNGDFQVFCLRVFTLLKNRHRLVSAEKYLQGTKSWLFTEENNALVHYGKEYEWRPYREAKWVNVVELLYDLGLVDRTGKMWKLSKLGRAWLKRIL